MAEDTKTVLQTLLKRSDKATGVAARRINSSNCLLQNLHPHVSLMLTRSPCAPTTTFVTRIHARSEGPAQGIISGLPKNI
jgi:hypothetical protein